MKFSKLLLGLILIWLISIFFRVFLGIHPHPSIPFSMGPPQIYEKKYPNLCAYYQDYRKGLRKRIIDDRLRKIKPSLPSRTYQRIYGDNYLDTYISEYGGLETAFECIDKFSDSAIDDHSCKEAETFLIKHNYLQAN